MRVLVVLTPLMYREAIAHSLRQHRPALDLRIAAPETAEEDPICALRKHRSASR